MFDAGRNRHRKPALYDLTTDSESLSGLSTRPLARWTKRKPSRRALVLLACMFVAAVYSMRAWNGRERALLPGEELEPQEEEEGERKNEINWDLLEKPPLFGRYHEAEMALPQYHVEDPFAGGKKYLWVENHVHSLGWGNYVQDLLFNAQLAYSAGRAFVFDNFTWDRTGSIYSEYNGHLIPSQIPLSALVSGPIVGGPFPENDHRPRAIAREYWHKICPEPMTVWTPDVKRIINNDQASALTVLNVWVDYLNRIDEPCLQIDGGMDRIFDMYLYGQKERLLDIWPTLSSSPLTRLWGYSPLIHATFDTNRHLFTSLPIFEPYYSCSPVSTGPPSPSSPSLSTPTLARCTDLYTPLPGLLALHLRRGDFADHCAHLARWGSAWMGFNSFPSFPDQWHPLPGGGNGETTPENMDVYMRRCFPSIPQIVAKMAEVRAHPAARGLKDVYVMTNGKREWVDELKDELRKMGGWERVASSRDVVLDKEQKEVAQAVDMMIGERAQVFVGNGWSSMSSNIVMMRLVRGQPIGSNRFW